jgi:hypothetical protein
MSFTKAVVSCRGLFILGKDLYGLFAHLDPGVPAPARLILRLTDPDAQLALACPFYAHIVEYSNGDLHEWLGVSPAEFFPRDYLSCQRFLLEHTLWPRLLRKGESRKTCRLVDVTQGEPLPVYEIMPDFIFNWQHTPAGLHALGTPTHEKVKGRLLASLGLTDLHWPYYRLRMVRSLYTLLREFPPGNTGGCGYMPDALLEGLVAQRDETWLAGALADQVSNEQLNLPFFVALLKRHREAAARIMGLRCALKIRDDAKYHRGATRYVPHFMLGPPTLVPSRELATDEGVRRNYLAATGMSSACVTLGGAGTLVRLAGTDAGARELVTQYGTMLRFVPVSFLDMMLDRVPPIMELPDLAAENDDLKTCVTPYMIEQIAATRTLNARFTYVGVAGAHLLSLGDTLRLLRVLTEGKVTQRVFFVGCPALAPLVDSHKTGGASGAVVSAVRELAQLPVHMLAPDLEKPLASQHVDALRQLIMGPYALRFGATPSVTSEVARSPAYLALRLRTQHTDTARPVVATFPGPLKMLALDELYCYFFLLKQDPRLYYGGVTAAEFALAFATPDWRPLSWCYHSQADFTAGLGV